MINEPILLLSIDEPFGRRCVSILNAEGHECSHYTIGEHFSSEALIDFLAERRELGIVIPQVHTASYTAFDLIRDMQIASLTARIDVVALTNNADETVRDRFIAEGGVDIVPVRLERNGLRRAVREALQKVFSRREWRRDRLRRTIRRLQSIADESEFRDFTADLFRALGYREVRRPVDTDELRGGANFYELSRFGSVEFIHVQVRIGNIQQEDVDELWGLAIKAFEGGVWHGRRYYDLNRVFILISGELAAKASTQLKSRIQRSQYYKRLMLYDKTSIADLVVNHARSLRLVKRD